MPENKQQKNGMLLRIKLACRFSFHCTFQCCYVLLQITRSPTLLFLLSDSNTYPHHRRCNQNRTLHKQSEGQYICVTVFFFFFFLYFLKAIFFAKIEIDNHHQVNQCHQHKSYLRQYSIPTASECEIYQQRLEQNIYSIRNYFFLTTFLS